MEITFNELKNLKNHVHFIGIGGISMSALATYCANFGFTVSGSDKFNSDIIKSLNKNNINAYVKHRDCLPPLTDVVVYSSSIDESNPELIYAKNNNILILKRIELLKIILKDYKKVICVAGSHGKTTTTAMISYILKVADCYPTVFLGGEDKNFGNLIIGRKNYAVVEACEYKKNFLYLSPNISCITNIDNDHKDSYFDIDEEIKCFNEFIEGSIALVNSDDLNCKNVYCSALVSYGLTNGGVYEAKNVKQTSFGQTFNVYKYKKKMFKAEINLKGKFNVYNALLSIGVCDILKVPYDKIIKGLKEFYGVKRRAETIGKLNNTLFICDYAHHPTEIKSFLKSYYDKDTLVVFQPHTYSRTKALLSDFVDVFKGVKDIIIYKTYSAREKYSFLGSAKRIYEKLLSFNGNVKYSNGFNSLSESVNNSRYKKVLFIGAGDIYFLAKKILKKSDKHY